MKEKEAVLETWGSPPLAVKKTCQAGQDNDSRVCGRWLGGEVETNPSALVGRRRRRVGGGVQRGVRLQIGGAAVGVLELQDLRREVETLFSLPTIWSLKERRLRWMTV